MWVDPELDVVAVLLTNATHPRVDLDKPVNALRARFANAVAAAVRVETASVGRYLIRRLGRGGASPCSGWPCSSSS